MTQGPPQNIGVLPPIPSASEPIAVAVRVGVLDKVRAPKRRSLTRCSSQAISFMASEFLWTHYHSCPPGPDQRSQSVPSSQQHAIPGGEFGMARRDVGPLAGVAGQV